MNKESNFKGTKAECIIDEQDDLFIVAKIEKKNICVMLDNGQYLPWSETQENAKLIVDAFNTMQECDLLPSELLKQRNELLEFTKEISKRYPNSPHIFNPANELIKKIESC